MKQALKRKLSARQYELLRMISYEWKRWKCRITSPRRFVPTSDKLHLGCGDRHLPEWFNVDLWNSDLDLDIASGKLPFPNACFESIVSQHVIEHLSIQDELIPLLKECYRCLRSGGAIWLSTPDMEKAAQSYIDHKNSDMIKDRQKRMPNWNLGNMPDQQFMNDLFHQQLEHRNLFDEELLFWTLQQAGFEIIERVEEAALLNAFPGFPERRDDYQSIYVKASK